jgi:hypothetical protein
MSASMRQGFFQMVMLFLANNRLCPQAPVEGQVFLTQL